mmetsp:Transcript_13547/g.39605  ORF Transcript_13547/g.39605 Transcript_13547/m.39605 type:complete len:211 (+) Transcript_13547:219-851(+)
MTRRCRACGRCALWSQTSASSSSSAPGSSNSLARGCLQRRRRGPSRPPRRCEARLRRALRRRCSRRLPRRPCLARCGARGKPAAGERLTAVPRLRSPSCATPSSSVSRRARATTLPSIGWTRRRCDAASTPTAPCRCRLLSCPRSQRPVESASGGRGQRAEETARSSRGAAATMRHGGRGTSTRRGTEPGGSCTPTRSSQRSACPRSSRR